MTAPPTNAKRWHGQMDAGLNLVGTTTPTGKETRETRYVVVQEREVSYRFHLHQHPYVQQLVQRLVAAGTVGLQAADTDFARNPDGSPAVLPDGTFKPTLYSEFFSDTYHPDSDLVAAPFPVKDLDFSVGGAYAVYNWELFHHVPITIAIHLSKNQRFAEAQRWFHYSFDPTDDSDGPTPERFWKVRPFQVTDVKKIEDILVNLATGADPDLQADTIRSIEAWKDAPFRPHVIARYRPQAYMVKTVMAYLDNLIAWGDSLFRQDTGEAIDEAMMLYVLAANLLGPRPQPVPRRGAVRPQTYANLRHDLSRFGTVLRDVEADIPFDLLPFPTGGGDDDRLAAVRSLGQALYFCVPRNDRLLGYWDTVADRLFKIRNSLNFQGVFRQLALFEPPIDPALLARGVAAGLDVGAIVNGLNQPLPLVRFQLLVRQAQEVAQEVKSLGNSLLSAMEREDGESLAILRAKHERVVMGMVEHVRFGQLQEAIKSREGLLESLVLAKQRYAFYEQQLGESLEAIEQKLPDLEELDKENLDDAREPRLQAREIVVDISQDLGASGGTLVSSHEADDLNKLESARELQLLASGINAAGAVFALIPDFAANVQPMGTGATVKFGGKNLSFNSDALAAVARAASEDFSLRAGLAARVGSYARRELEWTHQSNLAAAEINQVFKQLRAAEIREAIAELELKNHRQQMKHAEEIEVFLNEEGVERAGKKTNRALYAWMKREVKGLYSQSFQFAFDIARKAERALRHELGTPDLGYLQSGYLAGKEGLLAGDKLLLDLKRMEMAYLELNHREYELTTHASLKQLDPLAFIQLRETGKCTVRLPEAFFDMDGPGHYFRRIKTVAVSIPCVTGPFTSVNCTLTLLRSSIRLTSGLQDRPYERADGDDERFDDYFGSLQSIVTSTGQADSGMFETNLRDERYLPFEHSGAISQWQLELPANPAKGDLRQFDYDTIADVILHVRYTAREGGELLRKGAKEQLKKQVADAQASGSVRLLSVRHEFPTEWARFQGRTPLAGQRHELTLPLRPEHYPFWSQDRLGSVKGIEMLARSAEPSIDVFENPDLSDPAPPQAKLLPGDPDRFGGLLGGTLAGPSSIPPVGDLKLFFETNAMSDLWLAVSWGGTS